MGRKANKPTKKVEKYIIENLRYDPDTGHLWWTKKGGPTRNKNKPAGHRHQSGYIEVNLRFNNKQHRVMAHRIAWWMYYGYWPEHFIDHINNDKSDNRISNLREATASQNMSCRAKLRVTDSDLTDTNYASHNVFVGVYRIPSGNWIARCKGHVGTYETPEEAALAYNKRAKELYGDFAHQNDVNA